MGKGQDTDSDRESEYVTGLEDFPDNENLKRRPVSCSSDPCHTAFIQNILYEDSCAEVKVVDLFVAVKRVKDYVDFLSKCNSGLSEKIDELYQGTGIIRREYADLLKNTEEFLNEMNDVTYFNDTVPESEPEKTEEEFIVLNEYKQQTSKCGQDRIEDVFLKCKEKGPNVPEALLGSFLASFLWLQKEQSSEVNKTSLESAVRMMHKILDKVTPQKEETKDSSPLRSEETDEDQDLWSEISYASETRTSSPYPKASSNNKISSWTDRLLFAKESPKPRRVTDAISEGESEFEEALSEVKFSVNCMGDLTKAVLGKKSASTLTPTTNVTGWADKLSEDVKKKVKKLKESRGSSQSTITADAPVGVFDVTVVQFKKRRHLVGREVKLKKARTQNTSNTSPSPKNSDLKENYWSEDSLQSSDFESVDAGSQSSEDDLEEFLEVFAEKSKTKKLETLVSQNGKTVLGNLQKAVFKSPRSNFFEIQKCYPVNYVETLIQKSPKRCIDVEEVISLNAGEVRQKQVVIQGSSEDLVIFIQLEVEEDSNQNTSELFLEYQTNSLGTQTKEELLFEPLPNTEVIKLEKDEILAESLFDVWTPSVQNRITFEEPIKEPEVLKRGVLMLKEVPHRVEIWYPQRVVHQKVNVLIPQQVLRVSEETIKTITANAAELEKALSLIRKIENDIADVRLSEAISILPQLESELRKHLQSKMRDFGEKPCEVESNIDSYFSAVDFWPEEDSVTEEFSSLNSEDRLNNLLKMLSDLEEAVRSNERSKGNMGLCQFSSSKIYKLLHALTMSIRELEERPSITSLSQTLDIASQLDTAVREYDSIIKRHPFDYVGAKTRKRRNQSMPKRLEEIPAKQHLKNVRQKVFQIVEVEAVSIEERIERDFDRLDRIGKENDEALMFLEVFLQKTERRVAELSNLKSELQNLSASLGTVYERIFDIIKQRKEKEIERKKREMEMKRKLEKETLTDAEMKVEKETETEFETREEKETETDDEPKQKEETEKDLEVTQEEFTETEAEVKKEKETEIELICPLVQKKESKDRSVLTTPSTELSVAAEEKLVRETLSGLLIALDNLKSKAKEKHEACKEIFLSTHDQSRNSSPKSSKSSFSSIKTETMSSSVKEFKRIGQTSLYLAWTKPEGPLRSSIAGYQIHVDGKLNQKVRNPDRLQAVLYSIDLEKSTQIELYALVENNTKILLAILPLQPK